LPVPRIVRFRGHRLGGRDRLFAIAIAIAIAISG
jgi:hypothetical protein